MAVTISLLTFLLILIAVPFIFVVLACTYTVFWINKGYWFVGNEEHYEWVKYFSLIKSTKP